MQAELEKLIDEINTLSLSNEQFEQLHQYQDKLEELEDFVVKHENDGEMNCLIRATGQLVSFRRQIFKNPDKDPVYIKARIEQIGWANEGLERKTGNHYHLLNSLNEINAYNRLLQIQILASLSAAFEQRGDFEKCIYYAQLAEKIIPELGDLSKCSLKTNTTGNIYNSYGLACKSLGYYDKANACFKKSLNIINAFESGESTNAPVFALLNNIAATYARQSMFNEACEYCEKYSPLVESALENCDDYTKLQISVFLTTWAFLYIQQHDADKAEKKLQLAEKIFYKVKNYYPHFLTNILYHKSHINSLKGHFDCALQNAQEAFQYVFKNFTSLDWEENPEIDVAADTDKMQVLLMQPYIAKASALLKYFESDNTQINLLQTCLNTIDKIAVYFDVVRSNYMGNPSKFSLAYYSKNSYDIGQLACWYLYKATAKIEYAEKAFAYANKSKALVLLEEMNKKWFDKSEENISVTQVKTILKTNETLLEYSIGERGIFVYQLSKNKALHFDCISVEDAQQTEDKVKLFLKSHFNIYRPYQYETYQEEALAISEILILPYLKTVEKGTTLLIAPDGFLNALPFEAMVNQKKEVKSYNEISYLVDQYVFAYTFSAYLFYLNRKKKYAKPTGQFLYISPNFLADKSLEAHQLLKKEQEAQLQKVPATDMNYASTPFIQFENDQLDLSLLDDDKQIIISKAALLKLINSNKKLPPKALIYNAILVDNLKKIIDRKFLNSLILENEDANIKAIQGKLKEASCVLISSHAEIGKGIVLYNEKSDDFTFLSYEKIVQQDLQTQLVVLNMCDSGRGKNIFGEGYLSLGRAFFAAGSLNVIQTLYKVSDKYSARLIDSFFTCIVQQQLNFYEALRKAKLALRNDNNSHPKFWAGHVIYGKNGTL